MRLAAGLVAALAAAMLLNAGYFVQHRASNTLPRLSLRHPLHSFWLLLSDIGWLAGWLAGWLGWGLYIWALRLAPLSIVQSISAGGIGVVALLAWRWGSGSLSRPERVGTLACLGGIGLIVGSLGAGLHPTRVAGWHAVALAVGACVLMAAAAAAKPTARRLVAGAGLGATAGLLYAAGDIATKGAVSALGLLFVPVLLACHVLAFVALQLAFQQGTPLATAGLSTLLNNTVPIAGGIFLFGEGVPISGFGAMRLLGFIAVVAGSVLLARRGARRDPEEHAADIPVTARAEPVPARPGGPGPEAGSRSGSWPPAPSVPGTLHRAEKTRARAPADARWRGRRP